MHTVKTYTFREIIDFCSQYLPALAGKIRPTEACGQNHPADQMAAVFHELSVAHPEATRIYWGCRAWQLWIWQPVFLGVWTASIKGVSLNFNTFCHQMSHLFTGKYSVSDQTFQTQSISTAITQTASHLKTWAMQELLVLQPHYPMPEKLAGYFLGDAVLQALAAAQRLGLLTISQTENLAVLWQQALSLRCNGWLSWQDNSHEFQVERAGCCQHYRRKEADYCIGCPKKRCRC